MDYFPALDTLIPMDELDQLEESCEELEDDPCAAEGAVLHFVRSWVVQQVAREALCHLDQISLHMAPGDAATVTGLLQGEVVCVSARLHVAQVIDESNNSIELCQGYHPLNRLALLLCAYYAHVYPEQEAVVADTCLKRLVRGEVALW